MTVQDRPRVALNALRDLRDVLDTFCHRCPPTRKQENGLGRKDDVLAMLAPNPVLSPQMRGP